MRKQWIASVSTLLLSLPAWAQDDWDTPAATGGDVVINVPAFTTQDQLYASIITLVFGLASIYFLSGIFQARAIKNGENANAGKHNGISLALF